MFLSNVQILPQEQVPIVKSTFTAPIYMTKGFMEAFKPHESAIALQALIKVGHQVFTNEGASHFQVCEVYQLNGNDEVIKFYCIDNGDSICFLLSEEY